MCDAWQFAKYITQLAKPSLCLSTSQERICAKVLDISKSYMRKVVIAAVRTAKGPAVLWYGSDGTPSQCTVQTEAVLKGNGPEHIVIRRGKESNELCIEKGWVMVDAQGLAEDEDLAQWLERGEQFASALLPKH